MVKPEEIFELTDADVETLFPETLKEPQTDLIEELCIIWKPKWYQTLYYKVRCFIQTGKWPVRVWYIPWNRDVYGLDGELVMQYSSLDPVYFNKMFKRISEEMASEHELWDSLLRRNNPYYTEFVTSPYYKEFCKAHVANAN